MKYKIIDKCLKKDLKIPRGYRLMKFEEFLGLIRTDEELKKVGMDGYLWLDTFDGVRAVVLGVYYFLNNFSINAYDDGSNRSARGVVVKLQKTNINRKSD